MALSDYESTLKSYIHDDDKLVTYKWLSKEFEIHVNVAKDILKQYWEKNKEKEKITATHLLVGQLKDKSIRVEVVKESNLVSAKAKFMKVDCEHFYSLQKSLQDIELLAFAGDGDLRYSAIKCSEEYLRSEEEIEGLRYIGNVNKENNKSSISAKVEGKSVEKQVSKLADIPNDKLKNSISNAKTIKNEEKEEKIKSKKNENDKEEKKKVETESESNKALPEKKVSPPSKQASSKANSKAPKKPIQSKQSGFNHLFAKAQSKSQVSNEAKDVPKDNVKENHALDTLKKEAKPEEQDKDLSKMKQDKSKRSEKEESDHSPEKENKSQKAQEKSKVESKTHNSVSVSKNKVKAKATQSKKRNRSQEKNTSSKRKRIVVIDSSEDESNKSDNEEVEEEPMEIEEQPRVVKKRSPSPPTEKRENGKRMVRKSIEKTFKDEDGYLVTKIIHVYEAVSDNEDPVEEKKEVVKSKQIDTKSKKQTTLMNFFKKP